MHILYVWCSILNFSSFNFWVRYEQCSGGVGGCGGGCPIWRGFSFSIWFLFVCGGLWAVKGRKISNKKNDRLLLIFVWFACAFFWNFWNFVLLFFDVMLFGDEYYYIVVCLFGCVRFRFNSNECEREIFIVCVCVGNKKRDLGTNKSGAYDRFWSKFRIVFIWFWFLLVLVEYFVFCLYVGEVVCGGSCNGAANLVYLRHFVKTASNCHEMKL